MERYVCIHGHFYQPPRENPWLEAIELQDSAYPHHDWNERITEECYAPNSASRILNTEGKIIGITNNYAEISFNFGPTLLSWMESNATAVYQSILDADRESQKTFAGHGSALAQGYNHMIMPLANRRDKYTQVLWGTWDFEHRFGRKPEGMWLPETAVDLETLDVLAELGIKFTVLAPHQAGKVRELGSEEWQDVGEGRIDPTTSYLLNLPSGRSISLFFYDGPVSRAVAFERLLRSGEYLADRLLDTFWEERTWPQLVHIATDGETYGHHHRHGDMALAYALNYIESNGLAKLTNYGEYLEKHPPNHEVEILENTSWSCGHGIERWMSDCGCNSGAYPGWNQAWRAPLREALDWLRDTLAPRFEEEAGLLLKDPWEARDDYITVLLDRSQESIGRFLDEHAAREISDARTVKVLKLMELQRHAMLMYTSCGWFFDDLSGIETVQIIQYAGRAVQLAEELFGEPVEPGFLKLLERARSNIPSQGNGRRIYERFVEPSMVDLTKVAAHYAISSLFEEYGEETGIYCYDTDLEGSQNFEAGRARLSVGRLKVASQITQESSDLSFGVLHFGDHNLNAGVREYQGKEAYQNMVSETSEAFSRAEFPEVIRELDKHFGISTYSLRYLFRDEQRRVLDRILESTLAEVEASYRQSYELHNPLMRFLTDLGNPLPRALHSAAEFIINTDLGRALGSDNLDAERIRGLLEEASLWEIDLDNEVLSYIFKQNLESLMERFLFASDDLSLLQQLLAAGGTLKSLPFEVDLWKVQNLFHQILRDSYPELLRRGSEGDEAAVEWAALFAALGQQFSIQIA
jgi:alpha-amylase/alpha-mannosidase (GH57 family)